MHYYSEVNVVDYDGTIPLHPVIEQMKGCLVYRMLEALSWDVRGKKVLDAGTGTGMIARLLKGVPGLDVDACDYDPEAEVFFRNHSELSDMTYHRTDLLVQDLESKYDVIVSSGVFHHLPKSKRSHFLERLCAQCSTLIIADEAVAEYSSEQERLAHCDSWYGYVVSESEKRGLKLLAQLEREFWGHEKLATADDGFDFKESPAKFLADADCAGVSCISLDRLGDWRTNRGGFYIAQLRK